LALAGVLALSDRVSGELRQYNTDLLAAQEDLRRVADRDPLTTLMNRRALPEIMRRVQPQGALVLFFDLDGFKTVNDRHGHQMGDECLRRFANGLRECFRPGDSLVRYAGDEFVVVAQGLEARAAGERISALRARMRAVSEVPEVAFSVGTAVLEPGGLPDRALQAADKAMYEVKATRGGAPA
ncbi:MAG TPA: GGDEF domain-containing protein, partial [Vicinamibacteria bacterium]|nr:GGDEF domain-containing protein [Vicinamibacteria bacterium]